MSGRRITILGGGPSAIERRWDIMRYCEGTEIWTLNNAYNAFGHIVPAVSRWFELHAWDGLRGEHLYDKGNPARDHFERLAGLPCPVYTTDRIPAVSNQHQVPWVDVFAHHSRDRGSNYFLGSPSLMLALALYEHDKGDTIEYIQSWGIDTSDRNHAQQRQSWAYWVSQAHARGIQTGGTMCAFMSEPERDAGLRGLREKIGDALELLPSGPVTTNYLVATFATPNYMHHAQRLAGECAACGIATYIHQLPTMDRMQVMMHKPKAVRAALMHDKPVLMIDADDHLLKAPTVTGKNLEQCDFGKVRNCELDVIPTHLEMASCGAWYFPTPKGIEFVEAWDRETTESGGMEHRALHATYYMMAPPCGQGDGQRYIRVKDFTRQMTGCIEVTPRPGKGRPLCKT